MPCYYWLLCLLKLVGPVSLNRCFNEWVKSMLPESMEGMTISLDGKTIRSTEKMDSKSNEIPAVQELLEELDISGCIIVADAFNCQKKTAQTVISGGADYLLSVKDNHPCLKQEIADYVEDPALRGGLWIQHRRQRKTGTG